MPTATVTVPALLTDEEAATLLRRHPSATRDSLNAALAATIEAEVNAQAVGMTPGRLLVEAEAQHEAAALMANRPGQYLRDQYRASLWIRKAMAA